MFSHENNAIYPDKLFKTWKINYSFEKYKNNMIKGRLIPVITPV